MTYDQMTRNSNVVLVEFYATWCPHCQRMMPVVAQIKEMLTGKADVVQLDIDQNKEAAQAEDIEATPTFILYKSGKKVWRETGEISGDALLNKILDYVKK